MPPHPEDPRAGPDGPAGLKSCPSAPRRYPSAPARQTGRSGGDRRSDGLPRNRPAALAAAGLEDPTDLGRGGPPVEFGLHPAAHRLTAERHERQKVQR